MTPDDRPDAPVRHHLEWRIRIFGAVAIIGLVGMWTDQRWLVNTAIGVGALGVLLRSWWRRGASKHADAEDDEGLTS